MVRCAAVGFCFENALNGGWCGWCGVCSVWLLILPTVWLGPAESTVRVCSRVDEAGLFGCGCECGVRLGGL